MYVVSFLLLLPRPRHANRDSRAPRQHKQARSSNRRKAPAIDPMTMPAIAPPLSPPSSGAFTPTRAAPSVPTGVSNAWVVVAEAVAVTVLALVPLTGGVAVAVAQMEELPMIHWLWEQTYAAPQQVLPQTVSPSSALQEPPPPVAVGFDARVLHVEVKVEVSVSVTTHVVVWYSHPPSSLPPPSSQTAWPLPFVLHVWLPVQQTWP